MNLDTDMAIGIYSEDWQIDESTEPAMAIRSGAKVATHASATSLCRLQLANSVAVEVAGEGKWTRPDVSKIKYESVYKCELISDKRKRIVLQAQFLNSLSCHFFGKQQGTTFAQKRCSEKLGLNAAEFTFGGCIGGQASNFYTFEAFCE